MNRFSFTNGGETWARVTKKQARAAYDNGLTIMLCPVKMRPFTQWHFEQYASKDSGDTFDAAVNSFEYYNCNSETGRYTAFYVQVCGGAV